MPVGFRQVTYTIAKVAGYIATLVSLMLQFGSVDVTDIR